MFGLPAAAMISSALSFSACDGRLNDDFRTLVKPQPTCIHCGTVITAITHHLNDGFCMPCRDPFPGIKGTKHLLDVVSEAEIDTELAARGTDTGATFHRWLRM